MKNIVIFLLLCSALQLAAGIADYEKEFGFSTESPRHGKYYYLRQLLMLDHDPQIITWKTAAEQNQQQGLPDDFALPTELDSYQLSDSTLILNVNALTDLDMFSSLFMESRLSEYELINISSAEYSLSLAEPADYNLYTRMKIPELPTKNTAEIDIIPVTEQAQEALKKVIPLLNQFSYQIDNIFLAEYNILPQSGALDFIITIGPAGIEKVDLELHANARFSQGFLRKATDAIKLWQISAPVRIQYTLSRQYLNRL